MKTPRFIIRKARNGQYYFVLKAANSKVVLMSETYVAMEGARNGIKAIARILKDMFKSSESVNVVDATINEDNTEVTQLIF